MDLQANSCVGRAVLLVRSGVQCCRRVTVSFGKPYAEVYMMQIGRTEREGSVAGMLEMGDLGTGARTGCMPVRINPSAECGS